MLRRLAVLSIAFVLTGCAAWRQFAEQAADTPDRKERAAEAVREFEKHRDAAQFQAALDRCRQGDYVRAESMLTALIARRPEEVEPRLRLAEILASRGDAAAESHFEAILTAHPDHAEAHHAFGLFLDATDRQELANQHFEKAAQLDPANEVYRTTLASRR
jgi:Tfp pilus assembly protein PilF